MSLLDAFDISASGLNVQKTRIKVAASNLANINTTRSADGKGPYRRKEVIVEAKPVSFDNTLKNYISTAQVKEIQEDPSPPRMVYDPTHPDANANGYVAMPNISMVKEMVDMLSASRAYQANLNAMKTAKDMAVETLKILE